MIDHVEYLLVGDGPTDAVLVHIVNWLIRDIHPEVTSRGNFVHPGMLGKAPSGENVLAWRIAQSVKFVPRVDLIFVHRDAESTAWTTRKQEIDQAISATKPESPHIPVIPIRMTEAWLLISQDAIRSAASNPNSRMTLNLPSTRDLEALNDPKHTIHDLLKTASGLKGRRLRKFHPSTYRVAELIQDYSLLRQLSAFQKLESDVRSFFER